MSTASYDTNGDGYADIEHYDTDGDGYVDVSNYDMATATSISSRPTDLQIDFDHAGCPGRRAGSG